MKKKLIALALCISTFTSAVAGCTGNSELPNTEVTETESQAAEPTEATTESTEVPSTESLSQVDVESEDYKAFAECLDAILAVQAGAAGASLRAEEAGEFFNQFIQDYPANPDKALISEITKLWAADATSAGNINNDDIMECLNSTLGVLAEKNPEYESDEKYTTIIDGIKEGLQ